jgi:hypothetical protein
MNKLIKPIPCSFILELFFCSLCIAQPTTPLTGCADIPALAAEVSKFRGLAIKSAIACLELPRDKYIAWKQKGYLAAGNPDRLAAEEIAYKQIGLIPETFPYGECLAESYTSSLVASYDATLKAILLPTGGSINRSILAHELVHALQDQHFHLDKLQHKANQSSDSALSLAALIEGDALLIEQMFPSTYDTKDKSTPLISTERCTPPLGLESQFEFPYGFGLIYASRLKAKSSTTSLNTAFTDPPKCTSVILHAQAKPHSCPNWRAISLSSEEREWIDKHLGNDRRERFTESLGEYTLGLILSSQLERTKAILAAKGWTGDKLTLWQGNNGQATSLITFWEDSEEARQFTEYFSISTSLRFGVAIEPGAKLWQLLTRIGSIRLTREGNRVGVVFASTKTNS